MDGTSKVDLENGYPRVYGIAGTPDIVPYCRLTKDAFSYAHKRPRSWGDIPRAVYYVRNGFRR